MFYVKIIETVVTLFGLLIFKGCGKTREIPQL